MNEVFDATTWPDSKPDSRRGNPLSHTLDRANSDVVLIVDDVPDNLSLLHDALDESGYTVLVATSGEAALQRAKQAVPDIVLLDAMMPGMDGFEVAKRLKAMPETAHIPIVFMTGLTETEYLVAALEAGGVDYVTKPIKPKEVMARMGVHAHTRHHLLRFDGLGDVVHAAGFQRRNEIFRLCQARHEDDGDMRRFRHRLEALGDLKAVHAWHHGIEQHNVRHGLFRPLERGFTAGGYQHRVARFVQRVMQQGQVVGYVVNDEHHIAVGAIQRVTERVAPPAIRFAVRPRRSVKHLVHDRPPDCPAGDPWPRTGIAGRAPACLPQSLWWRALRFRFQPAGS